MVGVPDSHTWCSKVKDAMRVETRSKDSSSSFSILGTRRSGLDDCHFLSWVGSLVSGRFQTLVWTFTCCRRSEKGLFLTETCRLASPATGACGLVLSIVYGEGVPWKAPLSFSSMYFLSSGVSWGTSCASHPSRQYR